MLKVINYCFSIYFFSKGLHVAQPLQTASSATDEIYCYTRNLTATKERKREKKEPQLKKTKTQAIGINADNESRLLTRCVHRIRGETALQRERQYKSCWNIRVNKFRFKLKSEIKGSKFSKKTRKYELKGKHH